MPSTLVLVTRAAVRIDALFDISLDIDEHLDAFAHTRERAVSGVTSGRIGLHDEVTWKAWHLGLPFTMTVRITALDRPRRFVDEQVRGPFGSYRHEHVFAAVGAETVMVDTVRLGSPVWGRLIERTVLVPYLRRLLRVRNRRLLRALGAAERPIGTEIHDDVWPSTAPHQSRYEREEVIGRGDAAWRHAAADLRAWRVKTRSGFAVDSRGDAAIGDRLTILAKAGPFTIREPVEVVDVVDEDDRVGFAYRTRAGHPVRGEEAFLLRRRGDDVTLTIRSLTRPAAHPGWALVYPLLRAAQAVVRRRYRRALRRPAV